MSAAIRRRAAACAVFALALPFPAARALDAELAKAMRDAKNPVVRLRTSAGDITVELYRKEAPLSTANFLEYAKAKHYDGTIFHRVMQNFMIQGGGMDKDMQERPTRPPIKNESANGLANAAGTLAMARRPEPDSATDQFFINLKANGRLDKAKAEDGAGYAVFGKVIAGMDVVAKIATAKTASRGPHDDVPVTPITILTASILQP